MTDVIYPKFKKSLLIGDANANLLNGDVRVVLVAATYTYSATHQFLSDIASADRIAISELLTGKTVSDAGAFDSDDVTVIGVTSSFDVAKSVLFVDTGVAATSRLVLYQDAGLTGVPYTPNGSDVLLTVNAAGWFTL